jgi:acyl-CoA dehydrogenase
MTMKSQVEAMRAFGYVVAADIDLAHRHPDAAERNRRQERVELLTPVLKGWCTELGVEIASLGVQVHGGMGYIEETGACQHLRDARIATIYEGTTGIQGGDLVGRKLAQDKGAAMRALVAEMRAIEAELVRADDPDLAAIAAALGDAVQALEMTTAAVLRDLGADPDAALTASVSYLMLAGYVCGGWQMARAAAIARARLAEGQDEGFHRAKLATARFYADQVLPKAPALAAAVLSGASTALAIDEAQL